MLSNNKTSRKYCIMDDIKNNLKSQQKLTKISAIIILSLEVIFFIIEELLDLFYSINVPEYQELYRRKFRLCLFRIIGNSLLFIFIMVILFLNYYNTLLLGGIMYLVFGIIAFLYLLIEMNSVASSEPRPISYYTDHINIYLNIFYILAGIMLLQGSGLILYYVKLLYDEKKIKEDEEKLMLTRGAEEGGNAPLVSTDE